MTFSQVLTQQMEGRGWKPISLAAALDERGHGVSPQSIMKWLSGEWEPRLSTALVVSDILEFSLDALISRHGETTTVDA